MRIGSHGAPLNCPDDPHLTMPSKRAGLVLQLQRARWLPEAALTATVLITNDAALGRRAANLGVRWLRTADLIALCVRAGRIDVARGRAALHGLASSGRITSDALTIYLEEMP